MDSFITPPRVFNMDNEPAQEWMDFKERFDIYLEAIGGNEGFEEKRKCAVFKHIAGKRIEKLLKTLPTKLEKLEDIIKYLDDYFIPKSNLNYIRYTFFICSQSEYESYEDYVIRLREITKGCEFKDLTEGLIVSRFIAGITDDALRERLFREKDLSVDKVLELTRPMTLAKQQVEVVSRVSLDHFTKEGEKNNCQEYKRKKTSKKMKQCGRDVIMKREKMTVPDKVTRVDIKEEETIQIPYDGLTCTKQEEEIIIPDIGSEGSTNKIDETSLLVVEEKLDLSHVKSDKPYHCDQCDYKTKSKNYFKRHLLTRHTDHKFRKCPHCDYKSIQLSHLKTHIMSRHTGEKPLECPHCEFKTSRITNIKRHIMALHTGEKPHKCSYCDYKTIQYFTLKRHIMAHHTGEKPHNCPQCDYKTLHTIDLKRHVMVHHTGEKPFKCFHCDYGSVRLKDIKRHVGCHHTSVKKKCENLIPKRKIKKK